MISYKNRKLDISKSVEVYRNLTRKDYRYSVRQNGLVVAHTNLLYLQDCKFKVNENGRQWTIKNKKKTVHAVIQAYITKAAEEEYKLHEEYPCIITYNPYKNDSFVCPSLWLGKEIKVESANFVVINEKEVRGLYIN